MSAIVNIYLGTSNDDGPAEGKVIWDSVPDPGAGDISWSMPADKNGNYETPILKAGQRYQLIKVYE